MACDLGRRAMSAVARGDVFRGRLCCGGIATLWVRIGLGLISPDSAVFAPYYWRPVVAALVGGTEAGILATCLGAIAAFWFFVPQELSVASFRVEQVVSLILYGTSSAVIIWAAQSYRGLLAAMASGGGHATAPQSRIGAPN